MPKRLSNAQVEQYRNDGFCFPVDVMTPAQAHGYRLRIEEAEAKYPQTLAATQRNNAHITLPCLDEIVHHSAILDAVEDLIGPNILCWGTVMFAKDPSSEAYVSWHQDLTYLHLEPHDGVTAWLALTPSTPHTGCMRMIPGSHKDGIQPHHDTFATDNILTRGQNIDQVDESAEVGIILQPGQISLHHGRTIHGSGPNTGTDRRMGFAIQQYIPTYVKETGDVGYALLVRGEDHYHHFTGWNRPTEDMPPENARFRERVNEHWAGVLYEGAEQQRAY